MLRILRLRNTATAVMVTRGIFRRTVLSVFGLLQYITISESFFFDTIRGRYFDDNKAGKNKPDSQDEKENLRQKTDQSRRRVVHGLRNGQTDEHLNRQRISYPIPFPFFSSVLTTLFFFLLFFVEGRFASSSSFSWVSQHFRLAGGYLFGWLVGGWLVCFCLFLAFLPIRMTLASLLLLAGWILSDKHCFVVLACRRTRK